MNLNSLSMISLWRGYPARWQKLAFHLVVQESILHCQIVSINSELQLRSRKGEPETKVILSSTSTAAPHTHTHRNKDPGIQAGNHGMQLQLHPSGLAQNQWAQGLGAWASFCTGRLGTLV